MVQEFHVVRCFSCQSFQVQQVKKVSRWTCKVCGHKQSLLKEFGRGSGADCRRHVQKLNAMRGAKMDEQERDTWSLWEQAEAEREDRPEEQDNTQVTQTQVSCWSKYLDTPEKAEPEEEDVLTDKQLHGNQKIDSRKRKRPGGQTDGGQESWIPGQFCLQTNGPRTSLNRSSPPRLLTSQVSRWAQFFSTDGQVKKGEEPSVCGWSQVPPLSRPRPSLPVSSMFQSGEEFDFNNDFLKSAERF
ncbi:MRN complex-interacting protein isoform X1 [Larimichthys crocea]|uniref:MRN complex-interacting protein isoform X1 n=1 Tax=Larimichthys crocea TaxID=215358 RepID=UPI00054B4590|nr:MRN complex-interacting protein isoform X1 [Larimichthys crocea]